MPEFEIVYQYIKDLPAKERQDFIWDKIIYANPIKANETLRELDQYKPLVTYDNFEEIGKIRKHAPHAGLALRLRVPNTGAMVELSSKFGAASGEAVELIEAAHEAGLGRRGAELPRRQPDHELRELRAGAEPGGGRVPRGGRSRLPDEADRHRRRLSRPLRRAASSPSKTLARRINAEFDRLFPKDIEILAEPGRFLVATAGTAVAKVIGKAVRDGKRCYYLDDGVYHTFSGIIFDHCQYHLEGVQEGRDGDLLRLRPDLRRAGHDFAGRGTARPGPGRSASTAENIGAYSHASSTWFNGFPPAKVVHINR